MPYTKDDRYGHIFDASPTEIGDLYGYPDDGGAIVWDEEWTS